MLWIDAVYLYLITCKFRCWNLTRCVLTKPCIRCTHTCIVQRKGTTILRYKPSHTVVAAAMLHISATAVEISSCNLLGDPSLCVSGVTYPRSNKRAKRGTIERPEGNHLGAKYAVYESIYGVYTEEYYGSKSLRGHLIGASKAQKKPQIGLAFICFVTGFVENY